jgi:hypothetical protein
MKTKLSRLPMERVCFPETRIQHRKLRLQAAAFHRDISSYEAHRANRHVEYWVQRKQALHRSISLKPQNSEHHYCIIWVMRGFMVTQYLGQERHIGTFPLWYTEINFGQVFHLISDFTFMPLRALIRFLSVYVYALLVQWLKLNSF